jgi:hypothetical protein
MVEELLGSINSHEMSAEMGTMKKVQWHHFFDEKGQMGSVNTHRGHPAPSMVE